MNMKMGGRADFFKQRITFHKISHSNILPNILKDKSEKSILNRLHTMLV
jgi:hypothetical protein